MRYQMKILIDARRLGNNGIGRYLKGLVSGLCDIKPENEYLVIYQQGCEAALSQLPDTIVPIQSSVDAYSVEEFTCLPKIIKYTGADVVYKPKKMSVDSLIKMYEYAWDSFYADSSKEMKMAKLYLEVIKKEKADGTYHDLKLRPEREWTRGGKKERTCS